MFSENAFFQPRTLLGWVSKEIARQKTEITVA